MKELINFYETLSIDSCFTSSLIYRSYENLSNFNNLLINMSISVTESLNSMNGALTSSLVNYIKNNADVWVSFGKRDSHTYRTKFFSLMTAASLSNTEKFMVSFLFSVIKNKKRCLDALNNLADKATLSWYTKVKGFITTSTVQYTVEESDKKISVVHIPSCNPGVDLLSFCLMTKKETRTVENFFSRTTTVQLANDSECQEMSRAGYIKYWTQTVNKTNNTALVEAPSMNEEYYSTSASDNYFLIGKNLEEIIPEEAAEGYTLNEIKNYLESFN